MVKLMNPMHGISALLWGVCGGNGPNEILVGMNGIRGRRDTVLQCIVDGV